MFAYVIFDYRSLSQSVSLSQELSSARLRKRSFPDIDGMEVNTNGSRSAGASPRQGYLTRLERPNLSISLPVGPHTPMERSAASLEKEIMRLQEVLKERESDIEVLEKALREKEAIIKSSADDSAEEQHHVNGNGSQVLDNLTPKTHDRFTAIRRSMELRHPIDDDADADADASTDRLNELMLCVPLFRSRKKTFSCVLHSSMAQKESNHREVVDDLNEKLAVLRRQRDELSRLSRDQVRSYLSTVIHTSANIAPPRRTICLRSLRASVSSTTRCS